MVMYNEIDYQVRSFNICVTNSHHTIQKTVITLKDVIILLPLINVILFYVLNCDRFSISL